MISMFDSRLYTLKTGVSPTMNTQRTHFFLLLVTLITLHSQAQTPNSTITLPYEIQTEINNLKVKVTLRSIEGGPEGMFAEMTIGFKNPQTGEWIFFDAEKVPINKKDGFDDRFELKVRDDVRLHDIKFIREIIDLRSDGKYWWKCRCKDFISELQI
jgi:hypothetical protein